MKKAVFLVVSLSFFPRLLFADGLDVRSLAGEEWYGLYLSGEKSGYAKESLTVGDDGTVTMIESAHFRISMANIKQDMRMFTKRVYGPGGGLVSIESRVEDISGPQVFHAVVKDDALMLRTKVGEVDKTVVMPKPRDSLEDALKQLELVGGEAQVGDEVTYHLFEPMMQVENTITSRIVGVEERILEGAPTRVYRIKSHMSAVNLETVTFITQDGTKLEDVTAGMVTMRLEPEEIAKDVDYSNDVIVSNAASVDRPLEYPRTTPRLELRLIGPLTTGHLFNDERQFLAAQGDSFRFVGKRLPVDGMTPATLPIENGDIAKWTQPTTFVQSDNPELIEKAREIVGEETGSFAVSKKLCHWVYANVRTTYSARLSNAVEVLHNLEGDCTEHSILFVGLARAAGLPAREVAGLIYWRKDGHYAFLFHQWAKVWIGKWVDVDPTFNQPLADATHIKLAEGDLFEQAQLIPIIGRIQIEVVEEAPPDSVSR